MGQTPDKVKEAILSQLGRDATCLDFSSDSVFVIDSDGIIILLNETAKKSISVKPDSLIGKHYTKLMPDNIKDKMISRLDYLKKNGNDELELKINHNGEDIYVWSKAKAIYGKDGKFIGGIIQNKDITKQKNNEMLLKNRIRIGTILFEISSKFVSSNDLNTLINYSLRKIGEAVYASRTYIFFFRKRKYMDNTHEWCREGVSSQKETLQNLRVDDFSWWMKKLQEDGFIKIDDVSKMPPEAAKEKKALAAQDIVSLIIFPIYVGKELIGFMGIDDVKKSMGRTDYDVNLLRTISQLISECIAKHSYQEKLVSSRDELRRIIDSASELVVSVNKEGYIKSWNNSIAELTGIPKKDMLMTNVFDNDYSDNIASLIEQIKAGLRNTSALHEECQIFTSQSEIRNIVVNTTPIRGEDLVLAGVLLIGRDTTSQKRRHKSFQPGSSYLSVDENMGDLVETMDSFVDSSILYVSRENPDTVPYSLPRKTDYLILSKLKNDKYMTASHPDELLQSIEKYLGGKKNTVVLMNRIEYISALFTFNELLKFFYLLNDIIRRNGNILILNISRDCFDVKELSLLMQEFMEFPKDSPIDYRLDPKKLELLKYISAKNSFHINVHFGQIGKKFNLSRITTKKWITELERKGLLKTEAKGRVKYVYVSDSAVKLLENLI